MFSAVPLDGMSKRSGSKGQRAETALGATLAWRETALAEIARRGRGAHAACARAVGCKAPTLTQLLNGGIAVSPLVTKVSKHLNIPRPGEVVVPDGQGAFLAKYSTLKGADKAMVDGLVERLSTKPSNDG